MSSRAETQGPFQWASLPRGQEAPPWGGLMEAGRREKPHQDLPTSHPLT